ncbi:MAG TPA: type II toxin-antitoxin system Phd/YefM family antitoxin [Gammaproteobacteria bacterium]|nr:type II toxin-antitoxin system Phd/YefM family antitoxin [Gammaproteobacteria bacterium]
MRDQTISAQEIKRHGISAVDEALRHGPVHVIRRNRPSYVILSEAHYQRLAERGEAAAWLWDQLLEAAPPGKHVVSVLMQRLGEERALGSIAV